MQNTNLQVKETRKKILNKYKSTMIIVVLPVEAKR